MDPLLNETISHSDSFYLFLFILGGGVQCSAISSQSQVLDRGTGGDPAGI